MKKEGDFVKPGDLLASIETDKATVDFEMQEEGYVAKLLYPEGSKDVKLGTVIAILVTDKEEVAKFKDYKLEGGAAPVEATPSPKKEQVEAEEKRGCPMKMERPESTPAHVGVTDTRIFVSPLAKKTAEKAGIDLKSVAGSGPNGRILKADVEESLKAG